MPIKIPNDLPAAKQLNNEHIFVMDERMAYEQEIRPLKIIILNLMPTKIVTETQLLRLLSNSPLQVEVSFLHPKSYLSKNTPTDHLENFYKTFDEISDLKFDGMIITGAPVEHLEFKEVAYWDELSEIMEWSIENVTSTLHICWAAQAGLYYHYGVPKHNLEKKLFGIFGHRAMKPNVRLLRGLDDIFYSPHSRHTETRRSDIEKVKCLEILGESNAAGLGIIASKDRRQIYITGHFEYDFDTLRTEYLRDVEKGLDIEVPVNYFPYDDPSQTPCHQWKSHAHIIFANWLNYYVYQETPYDLNNLHRDYKSTNLSDD